MRNAAVTAVLFGLLFCNCSWIPRKPVRTEPVRSWEGSILTRMMDNMAGLAGMEPLREKALKPGTTEIRIWRGFGLQDLEAAVLTNEGGAWRGKHLTANDYIDITDVKVEDLRPPKFGWDAFWQGLLEMGILDIRASDDARCFSQIDGNGNLVELSANGTYRSYKYIEDSPCEEGRRLDVIAEFVGIQFDHADAECRQAEWFPCSKHLRKYRLEQQCR